MAASPASVGLCGHAQCRFRWAQGDSLTPWIKTLNSTSSHFIDRHKRAVAFTEATITQIANSNLLNNRTQQPKVPPTPEEFYQTQNLKTAHVRQPCLAKVGRSQNEDNPEWQNLCIRRACIINRSHCETTDPILYANLLIEWGSHSKSNS